MGENFLQEAIIRERLTAATPSLRLAEWLCQPANSQRVVDEVADVAAIAPTIDASAPAFTNPRKPSRSRVAT